MDVTAITSEWMTDNMKKIIIICDPFLVYLRVTCV